MEKQDAGVIERVGTGIDAVRRWGGTFWRISALMAKGAYLVGERQRLFQQLGEKVYDRIQKGEIKDKDWEAIVHQLDRVTKKIEIEEILIRGLRFGTSSRQAREEVTGS
jgi:hypothetical protein